MCTPRLLVADFDLVDEHSPRTHRPPRGKRCAEDQCSDEYRWCRDNATLWRFFR